MRKTPGFMLLAILAGGWFPAGAIVYFWNIHADPGPILSFNNPPFTVLNSPPPGGVLVVKWYGEKLIACTGTGESWVNLDNDPAQPSVSIRTNVLKQPAGPFAAAISYPIPAWLKPGAYDLQTQIQQICSGIKKPQKQRLPPVRFTVKDRNE